MYAAGNHSRGLRGSPRCDDEDVHSGTRKDVELLSDVFSSLPPIGDEFHSCLIVPSNGYSLPRRAHQPPSMMLYYH